MSARRTAAATSLPIAVAAISTASGFSFFAAASSPDVSLLLRGRASRSVRHVDAGPAPYGPRFGKRRVTFRCPRSPRRTGLTASRLCELERLQRRLADLPLALLDEDQNFMVPLSF